MAQILKVLEIFNYFEALFRRGTCPEMGYTFNLLNILNPCDCCNQMVETLDELRRCLKRKGGWREVRKGHVE